MARRKKVKLKKDQYLCVDGPLRYLYLPCPREGVGVLDHLPREVPLPDEGVYVRQVDYGVDAAPKVHYEWRTHV